MKTSLRIAFLAFGCLTQAVPFSSSLHKKTALVIIDMQNDFLTGSLANPRAEPIIPNIYKLLDEHDWPLIVASQDWHPQDHVSFASNHAGLEEGDAINITFKETPKKFEAQSVWADHCVPETWGSEIETGVRTRLHDLEGFQTPVNYIKKAQDHSVDSYSAFADNQYHRFTTMDAELRLHGIDTVVVTGVSTASCVRGTSIDAIKLGYEVVLLEDATEAPTAEVKAETIAELEEWGVQVMNLTDWEATAATSAKRRAVHREL
ncbi:Isochorismatase hydrolase [Xylariomycetidae sp. FL2044]|nr:Isochorismatase hydrolase [Xylariomycetidae sp. FL2044]